ncbi:hypothetical protein MBLNU457_2197t1 [Dothideomycetes sp. NU457]
MPLFPTSEEWLRQSSLLLEARPTTTRITTKYTVPNADSPRIAKKRSRNAAARERKGTTEANAARDAAAREGDNTASKAPKAYLELKTYDPESGVTLKYRTDKAAEVGRLIASLGRLGRHMAALPAITEDIAMTDAQPAEKDTDGTSTPRPDTAKDKAQGGQASAGGGGKKKKKAGKR